MSEINNWIPVFRSRDRFDVDLIQSHLKEMGVESVILDHQDSMFKTFNDTNSGLDVMLLVHPEDKEKAENYIEEHNKKA
jgi:hypothetical protein